MISCYTAGIFLIFFLFDFFRVVSLCEVVSNLGSVCFSANAYFVFVTLVSCLCDSDSDKSGENRVGTSRWVGDGGKVELKIVFAPGLHRKRG